MNNKNIYFHNHYWFKVEYLLFWNLQSIMNKWIYLLNFYHGGSRYLLFLVWLPALNHVIDLNVRDRLNRWPISLFSVWPKPAPILFYFILQRNEKVGLALVRLYMYFFYSPSVCPALGIIYQSIVEVSEYVNHWIICDVLKNFLPSSESYI